MLKKALKPFLIGSFLLAAFVSWLLTIFKSGLTYKYGMGFWGANGHDGIWHIALANNFAKFSFENPVFSGLNVQNYHLGFDLLLAGLNVLSGIPVSILYFQIIPILFTFLIAYLCYRFVLNWTKSSKAAYLSVFFVFFGGSMSWLIGRGESAFWSQQSISTLINPPFAMSLVFIFLGLINLQKKNIFLSILFFGILIQIKVYAGVLVLGGLFVSGIFEFIFGKNKTNLKIFLGGLVLSLIVFIPLNRNPQSVISWQPFWFLETMMSYSDRLDWQRFYSAMTTYKIGHIYHKGVLAYGLAFLIFILGNFWTRLIFLKDIFKKLDSIKVFILSVILGGILIPLVFVQNGTPWNTIQFVYYPLILSGILAGITLSNMSPKIIVFLILVTLPTTYMTLRDVYVPGRPPAKVSIEEMDALRFLSQEPEGKVLTYPFDEFKAKEAVNNPPRPLYLYESTAYVSAFSSKSVYLEDQVNLNIMGYDWKDRRTKVLEWYLEPNEEIARKFLDDNNIKYIYWLKPQRALLGESQLGLVQIFENKEVIIYRYGQDIGSH